MRLSKIFASVGAAAALSLACGGVANATVYTLDVQGCTSCGDGSHGTVTVTGEGTNILTVAIALTGSNYMNFAGNGFETIAFSLLGDTAATIGGLATGFTAVTPLNSEDNYHEDGLGSYDYAVNWTGDPQNNGGLPGDGIQTINFTINGATGSHLNLDTSSTGSNYMSVDVAVAGSGNTVNTGVIGASLGQIPTPEPATWSLMILGVGLVGWAMRRRPKAADVFA